MRRLCWLLVVVAIAGSSTAFGRTWTDNRGQTTEAKFVRVFNGKVVLDRGGKIITVPFYDLSGADQDYLREELTKTNKLDLIPPQTSFPAAGQGGDPQAANASTPFPRFLPNAPQPAQDNAATTGATGSGNATGAYPPANAGTSSTQSSPPTSYPPASSSSSGSIDSGRAASSSPPTSYPAYPPAASSQSNRPSGMPEFPRASSSTMGSPSSSMPSFSQPSPAPQMVWQKECMKCKKPVADSSKAGDRCPHCGVVWDYEQGEGGKVVSETSQWSSRRIGKVVGGVCMLVVFLFGVASKFFKG